METQKKRRGDRKDGRLLRELDSLHYITGIIYPNRCDNEAYIGLRVDLTPINEYLKKKNEGEEVFPYTMFHIITAALIKTITLRPKLNRFIANCNFYQRNEVTASFIVKKKFSDNGGESLAFIHAKDEETVDTLHEQLFKKIMNCRSEETGDSTEGAMDILNKMPRWLSKTAIKIICWLDRHGWVPKSMVESDPYYSSVVLSNLGSIGLKCGYHHLTNWGTCSIFCVVGERKNNPFFNQDGTFEMRDSVDLGLTIDERIADGYYYAKTVRLFKTLLENPELLELPLSEPVEY